MYLFSLMYESCLPLHVWYCVRRHFHEKLVDVPVVPPARGVICWVTCCVLLRHGNILKNIVVAYV